MSAAPTASSTGSLAPVTSPGFSIPVSTVSSTAAATSSSSSSGSTSMFTNGTNYFFGFLVAFIAFLFIFLSLGLLARRRRMRVMRDFMLYGPDDDEHSRIPQAEPVLWQPSYADAKGPSWGDIMPLSTSLVRHEVPDEKSPEDAPPRSSRIPLAAHLWIRPSRKPRRTSPTRTVTEAMTIAVMINMPQPPGAHDEDEPPECQIGTLKVPWKDEELSEP